jgi:hypothetical protein
LSVGALVAVALVAVAEIGLVEVAVAVVHTQLDYLKPQTFHLL